MNLIKSIGGAIASIMLITLLILLLNNESESVLKVVLLNSVGAILVLVICVFIFLKRTPPPIPPSGSVSLSPNDFEKLVTSLTDLRVAFTAVAYSATVVIAVLSFLGYSVIQSSIKELASDQRIKATQDGLRVLQDSLRIFQNSLQVFQNSLETSNADLDSLNGLIVHFERQLKRGLVVRSDEIMTVLNQYFIEKPVAIPDLASIDGMSISANNELLGILVMGSQTGSDSLMFGSQRGSRHRFRMILNESLLRMSLAGVSSKTHKLIARP